LAGTWYGHTRWVALSPAGAVSESVGIGCCRPQFDATYQLSDLRGTPNDATATATVTSFTVHPDFVHPGGPTAPKVGQTGTVTFKQGVLTLPFIGGGIPYCNAQDTSGVCGA
jgi:hypothetical protein